MRFARSKPQDKKYLEKFWSQLIGRSIGKTSLLANRNTSTDHWISAGIGRFGFTLNMSLTEDRARVELYIRLKEGEQASLSAFNKLRAQKEALEAKFGAELDWQDLPGKLGCRICHDSVGGWKTPEQDWSVLQENIIETLIKMEATFKIPVQQIA
jgi:hypothetical protein